MVSRRTRRNDPENGLERPGQLPRGESSSRRGEEVVADPLELMNDGLDVFSRALEKVEVQFQAQRRAAPQQRAPRAAKDGAFGAFDVDLDDRRPHVTGFA